MLVFAGGRDFSSSSPMSPCKIERRTERMIDGCCELRLDKA